MWTYYPRELLEGYEGTLSVSVHPHFDLILFILLYEEFYHLRSDYVTDMHALFAPSLFVTCPRYGRNLTWRLQLHQCLNYIKIKRFKSLSLFILFSQSPRNLKYLRLHVSKNTNYSVKTGLDTMQRLRKNLSRGLPCCGSEMSELQILQYSSNKRLSSEHVAI